MDTNERPMSPADQREHDIGKTVPNLPAICGAIASGLHAAVGRETGVWILAVTLGSMCKGTGVALESAFALAKEAWEKTETPA